MRRHDGSSTIHWGDDGLSPVRYARSVRAHGVRVPGLGLWHPLEEVLARHDYFRRACGLMHPVDLIYVSTRPRLESAGGPELGAEGREVRRALVMVRGCDRGAPSVRLVQDCGLPEDPPPGRPMSRRQ